jgi:DNA gyrase subunit A
VDAGAAVVTVAGSGGALPGTEPGVAKVTPLSAYPAKGRATSGVRCMRLGKGADRLLLAAVTPGEPLAATANGTAVELPPPDPRRDGPGAPLPAVVAAVG